MRSAQPQEQTIQSVPQQHVSTTQSEDANKAKEDAEINQLTKEYEAKGYTVSVTKQSSVQVTQPSTTIASQLDKLKAEYEAEGYQLTVTHH
ncbi:hypothetical protein D7I46_01445 [Lactococcus allomyrinae]|uniref:Uncharacterized protein n=1 Tax=Lactococcus allomyrinae TaxID=2419773 RepID=A0A387BBZ9_9LACT|nr:hypothetical protein D7I46_01445 [Lactococcus allomyrinae]